MRISLFIALFLSATSAFGNSHDDREKKKRHKEAEEHLQKAIDQMGQGAFDQALLEFESADALEPSPSNTVHIGECEEALGNTENAIAAYQKYLTDAADAPDADVTKKHIIELQASMHADAGHKLIEQKKFLEAIKEFELAQAAKPDPKIWYEIANAYEEQGAVAKAVENYRHYLKDATDAPDAGEVEGRISVLEGKHIAPPPAPPAPPRPATRKPFYTSKLGLGLAGGGVVALIVGAVFLGLSSSASGTADTAHTEAMFNDAVSSGPTDSAVGGVFIGIGIAALAASVAVLVLHTRPQRDDSPQPGQAPRDFVPQGWLPSVHNGQLAFGSAQ